MAGLSDAHGNVQLSTHVLNVTHPLVPDEIARFCAGKRAVLVVEEGSPGFPGAGHRADPAQGRPQYRAAWQGHAAEGRRVHAAGGGEGPVGLPGALRTARRAAGCVARRGGSHRAAVDKALEPLAAASAQLLHRLPRASGLLRHEASEARCRPDPRCRRHRLSCVRDLPAVLAGPLHSRLRHVAGLRGGRIGHAGEAADQRHGRRRLLAQRPADGRRRRGLQQGRLRPRHHEQRLFERDRHAGHSLERAQRGGPRPRHRHRSRAQEPGPDLGEARAHLRRCRRARRP